MYPKIKTTDFFDTEYVNYASYDSIRKIPSLIDGQKNAARKILWYTLDTNLKNELKVSQLDSKAAEYCEYLHGSMAGVIVNLAQDYVGTNNINLMQPEGNFGTRLIPEASAARYIFTNGTKEFFEMFNKDDNQILEHQNFEGQKIEPKFMLPKLPMLLINGSEGSASGFASKILPRNPEEIKKYLVYNLQGKNKTLKPFQNKPFYRGFKGSIIQGETKNQWIIQGNFTRKANKVQIDELPIGYSLKQYIKILDKLEEEKKIITYSETCNEDFNFLVQFNRKYLDSLDDQRLRTLLKLDKKVTENYTVINKDNQVQVFNNINDIFHEYIKVKLYYLQKRKDYLIESISLDIRKDISRYLFIQGIVNDTLVINKRPEEDIIKDLDKQPKIMKIDSSYNYLLSMQVRSMTKEKMEELMNKIKQQKAELDLLKIQTIENMWLQDLK